MQILTENPEIRHELDDRFRYVLVDEYQDTNLAQYQIIAGLSHDYPNLCVTGDPDQSIYGWRGARIENILRFEADYPQAAVIRLEENFRSTKSILAAADRLIAHNVRRKAKTMRTENPEGAPVEVLRFDDAQAEAEGIARAIRAAVEPGPMRWCDVAIFYRINALSREFETALTRHRIPYQDRRRVRVLRAVRGQGRAGLLAAGRQSPGSARLSPRGERPRAGHRRQEPRNGSSPGPRRTG